MAKYELVIDAPQKKGAHPKCISMDNWSADCPKCGNSINGYEVQQKIEELRNWHSIVAIRATSHTIMFSPCECVIRVPPDELMVTVNTGPKDDPGLVALANLVKELE